MAGGQRRAAHAAALDSVQVWVAERLWTGAAMTVTLRRATVDDAAAFARTRLADMHPHPRRRCSDLSLVAEQTIDGRPPEVAGSAACIQLSTPLPWQRRTSCHARHPSRPAAWRQGVRASGADAGLPCDLRRPLDAGAAACSSRCTGRQRELAIARYRKSPVFVRRDRRSAFTPAMRRRVCRLMLGMLRGWRTPRPFRPSPRRLHSRESISGAAAGPARLASGARTIRPWTQPTTRDAVSAR